MTKLHEKLRRFAPFAFLGALQLTVSLWVASSLRSVGTYDTASYFVIARNFAQGRGLTDTVLWQFLGTPVAVQRPAGEYWETGWPLVLGSIMKVFGHSQRAAIFICAVVSALLPIATAWVAYLVTRRAAVAWVAGLLICLQARLLATNTTPDATLMYQLACLVALGALCHASSKPPSVRGWMVTGLALALPMHVRGEGSLVFLLAIPLLILGAGTLRERVTRTLLATAGVFLLWLPFAIRNRAVFGHAMPPSRGLRLWMTEYNDLFKFNTDPSPSAWWAQGVGRLLDIRWKAIVRHLEQLTIQLPWPLLVLAAIGVVVCARRWARESWLLPLFLLFTLLAPTLAVPLIASVDRFVMNALPALCIVAAVGIFAIHDALRKTAAGKGAFVVSALAIAACAALYRGGRSVQGYVANLRVYRDVPASLRAAPTREAIGAAPGDVVLTDDPWRIAASLDVAAVMVPFDGSAAVDALIAKYRPRFLVVSGNPITRRVQEGGRHPLRAVARSRDATWYEFAPTGRE